MLNMAEKSKGFDDLLLASIDEALLSLGGPARQRIYFHLEKDFQLKRDEIPKKLYHFQVALEKIFGVGARYLEILVMKNLYGRIENSLNMENAKKLEFVDYVYAARQSFRQECCNENNC